MEPIKKELPEFYFADTAEAERALAAELVYSPELIPDVLNAVRPEMFLHDHARRLFELVANLFNTGDVERINAPVLYGLIDSNDKEWFRAKVLTYDATHSALVVTEHAVKLRKAFDCRRLWELAESLRASAMRGTQIPEALPEALEKIRSYQDEISTTTQTKARTTTQVFNALCEDLQNRTGQIPTGYPSLDKATYGGFAPGNLVILAARPSVGKTSVALDIARSMSYNGTPVCFFSLEMSASELAKKLCLGTERLYAKDFRHDSLNWQRIEQAGAEIAQIDILIDDRSLTLDDICTQIVLLHSQKKIGAAMIDYLGLIEVSKDMRIPKAVLLSEATRRLKLLAKKLQIPVVILCQLNRDSSKEHRAPELYDLRDSGAIEQDADIVLMLERNTAGLQYGSNDLESRRVDMWVRKNRGGQAGNFRIDLEANANFSRFHEIINDMPEEAAAPATPAPADSPADFENVENEF